MTIVAFLSVALLIVIALVAFVMIIRQPAAPHNQPEEDYLTQYSALLESEKKNRVEEQRLIAEQKAALLLTIPERLLAVETEAAGDTAAHAFEVARAGDFLILANTRENTTETKALNLVDVTRVDLAAGASWSADRARADIYARHVDAPQPPNRKPFATVANTNPTASANDRYYDAQHDTLAVPAYARDDRVVFHGLDIAVCVPHGHGTATLERVMDAIQAAPVYRRPATA